MSKTTHTFVYVLKLVKGTPEKLTSEETAIVDEHFDYLKKALTKGQLTLAGRCVNGEFGIVIFQEESEKQANEFMKNDPAVKNGVMTAELHPFRIALLKNG